MELQYYYRKLNMLTFYTYKCEDYADEQTDDEVHLWGLNEKMEDVLVRVQGFKYSFIVEVPQGMTTSKYGDMAAYIRKNLKGMVCMINGIELYDYQMFGTVIAFRVYLHRYSDMYEAKRKLRLIGDKNRWKCQFRVHQSEFVPHLQYMSQYRLSYGNWHCSSEFNEVTDDNSRLSRATHEYTVRYDKLNVMTMEVGCAATSPCTSRSCLHNVSSISIMPRVLSYDIECYSKKWTFPNPNNIWDEVFIITASVMDRDGTIRNTAFIRHGYSGSRIEDTTIVTCENEEELLIKFQEFIIETNPEICIGYNTDGFDNPYITQRLYNLGLQWMNISKLKNSTITTRRANKISTNTTQKFMDRNKREAGHEYLKMAGRLHIDLLKHMVSNYKLRSYSLDAVSRMYLQNEGKHDVKPKDMFRAFSQYDRNVDLYNKVVAYGIQDAVLPIKLYNKLLVFLGLSKMADVMYTNIDAFYTEGSSFKVKNMIYMRCVVRKVLLRNNDDKSERGYQGALILNPDVGLHENVYTLDLDSLYPNIIRSYNICFTTLVRDHHRSNTKDMPVHLLEFTDNGKKYSYRFRADDMIGVIPELCGILIETRTEVRSRKSSDPIVNMVNDKLQLALKIAANSIYGILGLSTSSIAFMEGARSVTAMGRIIISKIVDRITNVYGHKVVYGDTDSVMAKIPGVTDNAEVYKMAEQVRDELNVWLKAEVGKNLGLKLEKVGTIFLLKKKKYVYHFYIPWEKRMEVDKAGNNVYHTTGAESVRRDKCIYQIDLFDTVSDMIMKATPRQQLYDFLYNAGVQLLHRYDVLKDRPLQYEDLFINYAMNDYYKNESFALAILMKRLKEENYNIHVGERTDVIITTSGSNKLGSKLFTANEFYEQMGITDEGIDDSATNSRDLHPDIHYYIANRMQKSIDNLYTIAYGKELESVEEVREDRILGLLEEYSTEKCLAVHYNRYPNWRSDSKEMNALIKLLITRSRQKRFYRDRVLRLLVFRLKLMRRATLDVGIQTPLKQLSTLYKYRAVVLQELVHKLNSIEEDVYDDSYYE